MNYQSTESAVVRMDNSTDSSAAYAIEANANVTAQGVERIFAGQVKKDGREVANFDVSAGNISITIYGVEREEQAAVLDAVNAFADNVSAYIEANPVINNN